MAERFSFSIPQDGVSTEKGRRVASEVICAPSEWPMFWVSTVDLGPGYGRKKFETSVFPIPWNARPIDYKEGREVYDFPLREVGELNTRVSSRRTARRIHQQTVSVVQEAIRRNKAVSLF